MKVLESTRKNNTAHLKIEEDHSALETAMEKAFHRLKKHAKIPGFRKGKITRSLFEKHYGKEILIKEAMGDVVNDAYVAAIKEKDLAVVDYPKNMNIEEYRPGQPIVFSCDVDLIPEVKLGKYKGIKAKRLPDSVDDAALKTHIDSLIQKHATFAATDAPAKEDDILKAALNASIDGNALPAWSRESVSIRVGAKSFGEEFDLAITGLKAGDTKTFEVSYPADFHNSDVAGKTVSFDITANEVQSKTLPTLTDELVQKISSYKTVDEFQEKTKEKLDQDAKNNSESSLREEILTAIIEDMKVDLHPILIEREIDDMVREFETSFAQSGISIDRYLQLTQSTMAGFRDQLRENATRRVKVDLALNAVCEKEKIDASADDISTEIKNWNLPNVKSDDEIRSYAERINSEMLKSMIRKRKAMEFLIDAAKISN